MRLISRYLAQTESITASEQTTNWCAGPIWLSISNTLSIMSQDSQQPQHSFLSCSAAILLDSIVDFGDAQIVSIKVLASASIAAQEQIDNWFSHPSFSSLIILFTLRPRNGMPVDIRKKEMFSSFLSFNVIRWTQSPMLSLMTLFFACSVKSYM